MGRRPAKLLESRPTRALSRKCSNTWNCAKTAKSKVFGIAHGLDASFASAFAANFSYAFAMVINVSLSIGSVARSASRRAFLAR